MRATQRALVLHQLVDVERVESLGEGAARAVELVVEVFQRGVDHAPRRGPAELAGLEAHRLPRPLGDQVEADEGGLVAGVVGRVVGLGGARALDKTASRRRAEHAHDAIVPCLLHEKAGVVLARVLVARHAAPQARVPERLRYRRLAAPVVHPRADADIERPAGRSVLQVRQRTLEGRLALCLTQIGLEDEATQAVRELVVDRCASEARLVALQEVDPHHHPVLT